MLMACGCLLAGSAHAQWVVTDPTNLAQSIINTTKEIVQTSKTVKNTLDNFKEVEKLYNESKKYYDALKKVNDLVRDAQRISGKTKCTYPEKRNVIFYAKTKCA